MFAKARTWPIPPSDAIPREWRARGAKETRKSEEARSSPPTDSEHDLPSLNAFIVDHMAAIIEEWQTYAASLEVMEGMDVESFRSEATAVLSELVSHMRVSQTSLEQQDKSRGLDLRRFLTQSAAKKHGAARRERGFTAVQLVAEIRALRATVIRLWVAQLRSADLDTVYELTRFHEAIDQAMSDSIANYSQRPAQSPA
jgi:hypothetical protein